MGANRKSWANKTSLTSEIGWRFGALEIRAYATPEKRLPVLFDAVNWRINRNRATERQISDFRMRGPSELPKFSLRSCRSSGPLFTALQAALPQRFHLPHPLGRHGNGFLAVFCPPPNQPLQSRAQRAAASSGRGFSGRLHFSEDGASS